MAKDIRAIQCPKCGSVYKKEIKPEFYKCEHCQTEYYLNSDDVHIYHHHERLPPLQSSAPPGNSRLPVYILIGAVTFIVVVYFAAMLWQPQKSNTYGNTNSTAYKPPRMYYSSFVYTNTVTGDPIYLRLGTDYVDKGNGKSEQELHVQFNNATNGKLVADRIMNDDGMRDERCALRFKTYSANQIYAIGCNSRLLELDVKNNQLNDITKSLFKDYTQLSSGVAKLDFDYDKDIINVMSNEGNSYFYFPTLRKLVASKEEADSIWKKEFDRYYFTFGYMGTFFNHDEIDHLMENNYNKETGELKQRDLTPGRRYFAPKVLYQDKANLLIQVNATAAENSPVTIQAIDINSGKIKWALPPDSYDLYSSAKCKQGFAIEYRKGEEADYIHGVLIVSATGQLVYNYKLARTE
jgi:hypothetical protein